MGNRMLERRGANDLLYPDDVCARAVIQRPSAPVSNYIVKPGRRPEDEAVFNYFPRHIWLPDHGKASTEIESNVQQKGSYGTAVAYSWNYSGGSLKKLSNARAVIYAKVTLVPFLSSPTKPINRHIPYNLLPSATNRLHHLVRKLEFENNDKTQWIAQVQMGKSTEETAAGIKAEVDTICLLADQAYVPVPRVFGCELADNDLVRATFKPIEFLPRNVAPDACGGYTANKSKIPKEHREKSFSLVARIQAEMTSARLPIIGRVLKDKGGYSVGPLPGIGGPFETATAFLEAWGHRLGRCVRPAVGTSRVSSLSGDPSGLYGFTIRRHAVFPWISDRREYQAWVTALDTHLSTQIAHWLPTYMTALAWNSKGVIAIGPYITVTIAVKANAANGVVFCVTEKEGERGEC
ncbi:uncharacterized protein LY79DRAFT_697347 [Colletotrichum navitas]|uniref:Uncharacterized protein n=1 Tax=Colletotrichum navitas TaxID=681940 RepID=A0AAD8VA73_9PEZI|nr:uncharacterized protein LY79DRAFT_697347 [Colletotrichum navitas]KAK1597155.1 hypothetical protein LY79DRAFT_697347 [Colletotrichum navitas]